MQQIRTVKQINEQTYSHIFIFYLYSYVVEMRRRDVLHLQLIEITGRMVEVVLPHSSLYKGVRLTSSCAVIPFHFSLSTAFSLHLSPSSAFLTPLLMQSSHLKCCLPIFLRPRCLIASALVGSHLEDGNRYIDNHKCSRL